MFLNSTWFLWLYSKNGMTFTVTKFSQNILLNYGRSLFFERNKLENFIVAIGPQLNTT